MKTCKKCGTERADSVRRCPVCRKAYHASYRAANREKINFQAKAHNAAYHAANKEHRNLKSKAYHAANPEK